MKFEIYDNEIWISKEFEETGYGQEMSYGYCTECEDLIVFLKYGEIDQGNKILMTVEEEEIIYPKYSIRDIEPEVPDKYRTDYEEACGVLSISPKASAAISRRILQNILREEFKINYPNLAKEIDEFIDRKDIPTYLGEAVDAIRNIGNFAAHPLKDTSTGEIIEVEVGEAEWLLDVNESLFDFVFVQPKKLAERKKKLNDKLKKIGKPPMKNKKP